MLRSLQGYGLDEHDFSSLTRVFRRLLVPGTRLSDQARLKVSKVQLVGAVEREMCPVVVLPHGWLCQAWSLLQGRWNPPDDRGHVGAKSVKRNTGDKAKTTLQAKKEHQKSTGETG